MPYTLHIKARHPKDGLKALHLQSEAGRRGSATRGGWPRGKEPQPEDCGSRRWEDVMSSKRGMIWNAARRNWRVYLLLATAPDGDELAFTTTRAMAAAFSA